MTSAVDLLNRSLGTLTPSEFIQIQNARSLEALQLQPWPRFGQPVKEHASSSHRSLAGSNNGRADIGTGDEAIGGVEEGGNVIAHRAGVNIIAIDRFEGR